PVGEIFSNSTSPNGSESGRRTSPPPGSSPLPDPRIQKSTQAREKKGRTMNPLIPLKKLFLLLLIVLLLGCFWLLAGARGTDLDGVLPGGNNADGFGVLTSLTTGTYNTGCGWFSLSSNQGGDYNTAFGAGTLLFNTTG